jgi:hypothetical protein
VDSKREIDGCQTSLQLGSITQIQLPNLSALSYHFSFRTHNRRDERLADSANLRRQISEQRQHCLSDYQLSCGDLATVEKQRMSVVRACSM